MRSLEQRISEDSLHFNGLWLNGRNRAQERARRCSSPFREGAPTCGVWCLIIRGGADVIIVTEIKCTASATCLNHPGTIPWPWLVEKLSPMQLAADAKRPLILGIWEEAISLWSAGGGDEEDSNEKVGMLPLYIYIYFFFPPNLLSCLNLASLQSPWDSY